MVEQKIGLSPQYHVSNESTSCRAEKMIGGLGASQVTPYVALLPVRLTGLARATEHGVGFSFILFYLHYSNSHQSPCKLLQMCFCKGLMAPSFPVSGAGWWESSGNLNIPSAKRLKAVLKLCSFDSAFSSECSQLVSFSETLSAISPSVLSATPCNLASVTGHVTKLSSSKLPSDHLVIISIGLYFSLSF